MMNNEFGKMLKHIRSLKGMTQKELAEKSGISVTSLSTYENGSSYPSIEIASRISKSLDCSLDLLAGNKGTSYSISEIITCGDILEVLVKISYAVDVYGQERPGGMGFGTTKVFIEHESAYEEEYDCPEGPPTSAIFKIENRVIASFFAKWEAIRVLYLEGLIDSITYRMVVDSLVERTCSNQPEE